VFNFKTGHELLEFLPEPKKREFLRLIESGKLIPLEDTLDVTYHCKTGNYPNQPPGMRRLLPTARFEELQEQLYFEDDSSVAWIFPLTSPEEIAEIEAKLEPAKVWKELRLNARQEGELYERLLNASYEITEEQARLLSVEDIGEKPNEDLSPVEIPDLVICFYEEQNRWHIGPLGKELTFQTRARGFKCLHTLLENPNRFYDIEILYNLFQNPHVYDSGTTEYSSMTREQLQSEGLHIDNVTLHEVTKQGKDVMYDHIAQKKVEALIRGMQDELDELEHIIPDILTTGQENRIIELNELIKSCRSHLKDSQQGSTTSALKSKKEKSSRREAIRVSVYNYIRGAIKKIHSDLPIMTRFLNERTVSTGQTVVYRPDPGNQPKWILHSEDRRE
jgi:hypothetical protein